MNIIVAYQFNGSTNLYTEENASDIFWLPECRIRLFMTAGHESYQNLVAKWTICYKEHI